ncbi:butyrate kinase [Anaeromyxobacter paludicola]|uniref:Probable butyrate kinase n=1 Tax=Anaeromyxobacter paludicola TaxID=2918171 RepID=A0ABN6NCZ4_9BACT|nr:butyrate kinase [Anaeromyxobacter paludicola]BDG09847.1 putative butyrate kinase [Anaeromyxobacter paludicola]
MSGGGEASPPAAPLLLAVNPGAGSTKLGLFRGAALVSEHVERHDERALAALGRVAAQRALRAAAAREFLARAGVRRGELAAVVGRGGLFKPLESGAYLVEDAMLRDAEAGARGDHAANLGALLAAELGAEHGCPALVVDAVSLDELEPVARISGLAGVERTSLCHALNMRAVARRHARTAGRPFAEARLVVAHLGTGASLAAVRDGRLVDVVNPQDEGPFSGDRSGGVPATALIELCFAPGADRGALRRRLFGDGGLHSYLGTRDVREVARRAREGDAQAALVLDAAAYQLAKAIGEMATVLEGRVDAILLTGGAVNEPALVERVRPRVEWIAPVALYPGEDELRALAEGALRVLAGEEPAKRYG